VEFNRGKSWRQLRWCSHQCGQGVGRDGITTCFTILHFLSFFLGGGEVTGRKPPHPNSRYY